MLQQIASHTELWKAGVELLAVSWKLIVSNMSEFSEGIWEIVVLL